MFVLVMASVIDFLLDNFDDCLIGRLSLTIPLWVVWCGEMVLDMEVFTKLMDILIFERTIVFYDDGLWYTILENDVVEDEFRNFLASYVSDGDGFDPLSELLSGDDNEFKAIGRGRIDFFHEVKSPLHKGPQRIDWSEFLYWCMNQITMYLTVAT